MLLWVRLSLKAEIMLELIGPGGDRTKYGGSLRGTPHLDKTWRIDSTMTLKVKKKEKKNILTVKENR